MGLRTAVLLAGLAATLSAASVLRLVTATVGPLPVAPGSAAGTQTVEALRVSDPNAIDAPQTITVTVRVGGIDLYAAPGTIREAAFTTSAQVNPAR